MHDLYHVRGHSYYAIGILMWYIYIWYIWMWYAKELKAMNGIHALCVFSFVDV